MRKEVRQILFVCVFCIIGCVVGYIFAVDQINQLQDADFIRLLNSHNIVASGVTYMKKSILLFGWIFAGIATGIIFYLHISKKRLTAVVPKVFMGIITFPFYTFAGVIIVIPFVIYNLVILCFKAKMKHKLNKIYTKIDQLLVFIKEYIDERNVKYWVSILSDMEMKIESYMDMEISKKEIASLEESYKSMFVPRDGLGDFYIIDSDKEIMKEKINIYMI